MEPRNLSRIHVTNPPLISGPDDGSGRGGEAFTLDEIAEAMEKKRNDSGGGGVPPEFVRKTAGRQTWILAAVMTLFGAGGPVGSYYALKGQAEENAAKIEEQLKRIDNIEEAVTRTRDSVIDVKSDVASLRGEQKDKEIQRLKEENERLRSGRRMSPRSRDP